MSPTLAVLLVLATVGCFHLTVFHARHLEARKPLRHTDSLVFHATHCFLFAMIALIAAWCTPHGAYSYMFVATILLQTVLVVIQLFEDDEAGRITIGERIVQGVLGALQGAFLAVLTPELFAWKAAPSAVDLGGHGSTSIALTACAVCFGYYGLRDVVASLRESSTDVGSAVH